ncbi:MAG: hypothetical protein J6386_14130 [Candidatus Synoicihabitans palmerolidicus]|nr:hypothetical protein [Candidatus Synoicihabitans palmerolidicus]
MTSLDTPPVPSAGDHLVDWTNFESILSFTNASENPELLRRIIVTYQTNRGDVLAEVSALGPDDHTATRLLLHKFKGSTGSLAFHGRRRYDQTPP